MIVGEGRVIRRLRARLSGHADDARDVRFGGKADVQKCGGNV
jgi:hypothetical protein